MNINAALDREVIELDAKRSKQKSRIELVPFDRISLSKERRYLVKGLVPHPGLTVIWGAPKSGKSFWTFDLTMHVALDRPYRERRVHSGPVVYCCFEGQSGIQARVEAFRQKHLSEDASDVPFYLQPVTLNLVKEHTELIAVIRTLEKAPVAVVLDTLNRSLNGSESSDEDMSNYVRATDAIREAFDCAVMVVHHCGVNDSRPRGHTSLTGAADAQLAVKRDLAGNVTVTVEFMKDGESGETVASKLESLEVGLDEDGDPITSCIMVETEATASKSGPRLTANQQTMLAVLQRAGKPLTADEWSQKAIEAGLGSKRRAWAWDLRMALQDKGLVYEGLNGWSPK